jgi:hypothetical protein
MSSDFGFRISEVRRAQSIGVPRFPTPTRFPSLESRILNPESSSENYARHGYARLGERVLNATEWQNESSVRDLGIDKIMRAGNRFEISSLRAAIGSKAGRGASFDAPEPLIPDPCLWSSLCKSF